MPLYTHTASVPQIVFPNKFFRLASEPDRPLERTLEIILERILERTLEKTQEGTLETS